MKVAKINSSFLSLFFGLKIFYSKIGFLITVLIYDLSQYWLRYLIFVLFSNVFTTATDIS